MNEKTGTSSPLRLVIEELNVPDLRYLAKSEGVDQDLLERCISHFLSGAEAFSHQSAVSELRQITENQSLPAFLNNAAFITDRVFDVWLRKNLLEPDINEYFSRWRFVFSAMLWNNGKDSSDSQSMLVSLIDQIAIALIGWSPRPERSKKMLLERLSEIESMIFSRLVLEPNYVSEVLKQWEEFDTKLKDKATKLEERLLVAESSGSKMRESERKASHLINELFVGKNLSTAMIDFVCEHWKRVYALAIQKADNDELLKRINLLNRKLLAVFYGKGDAVFNLSEQLTDELIEVADGLGASIPPAVWQAMQQDMICMMQGQFFNEAEFLPIPTDHPDVSESFIPPKENSWLKLKRDDDWDRAKVLRYFEAAEELLLVNHLGMKTALFHREDFEILKKQKLVEPIPSAPQFNVVISTALNGLVKVAAAQQKERKKAAEKAVQEAKALQEAKRIADEKAKIQAEEISKRAEALKSRMEEKKRLNQERKVLETIQQMKLGAWIAIIDDDAKKRYKLIVKLAATQKYIFVDKLGIAKKEFLENGLLEKVLGGTIEILSDGAEFEDSLERVVSRIRISR